VWAKSHVDDAIDVGHRAVMAKRRRSNTGKRKSKPSLPKAAELVGFTDADEAFFAAGTALEQRVPIPQETFHDLDTARPDRPSFWRRLFARAEAA
jgi:hypothetical protein